MILKINFKYLFLGEAHLQQWRHLRAGQVGDGPFRLRCGCVARASLAADYRGDEQPGAGRQVDARHQSVDGHRHKTKIEKADK